MFNILCFIGLLTVFWAIWQSYLNIKWKSKPLQNFPFEWRGKQYWYSRSCAVSSFIFCKNSNGELCVLGSKRGIGAADFQGFWNCICGYLDFNETDKECAIRELKEESGLDIPLEKLKFWEVSTNPTNNKQNVNIRFVSLLDGTTDDWSSFSTQYMERNEVAETKWIPLKDIKDYKWAFNHNELILNAIEKVLE